MFAKKPEPRRAIEVGKLKLKPKFGTLVSKTFEGIQSSPLGFSKAVKNYP
jgi:hypothetical protein